MQQHGRPKGRLWQHEPPSIQARMCAKYLPHLSHLLSYNKAQPLPLHFFLCFCYGIWERDLGICTQLSVQGTFAFLTQLWKLDDSRHGCRSTKGNLSDILGLALIQSCWAHALLEPWVQWVPVCKRTISSQLSFCVYRLSTDPVSPFPYLITNLSLSRKMKLLIYTHKMRMWCYVLNQSGLWEIEELPAHKCLLTEIYFNSRANCRLCYWKPAIV